MSIYSKCPACRELGIGSCKKCKQSKKISQRKRKEKLAASNLCVSCGKRKVGSSTTCDYCKQRARLTATNRKGVCTACGRTRNQIAFVKGKNLCKSCCATRSKQYRADNPKHILRHNEYSQENFRNWFRISLIAIKSRAKKSNLVMSIGLDDIIDIFGKQNGKCVLTGVQMTHNKRDLRSASIDQIIPGNGYTKDNIQIVCKAMNFAKNNHSNEEVLEFLREIKNIP